MHMMVNDERYWECHGFLLVEHREEGGWHNDFTGGDY